MIVSMFDYTELTIFVRQIANGSMALGALFIIAIFGTFVWRHWHLRKESVAVKAAIAILILTTGHAIRSFSGWLEFFWVEQAWDISVWRIHSWWWFIISAALILLGKALMLLNFAPWARRKLITTAAVLTAIFVPLVLSIAL